MPPADPPAKLRRSSTGTWRLWIDLPGDEVLEVGLPITIQRVIESACYPDTLELWERAPHAV